MPVKNTSLITAVYATVVTPPDYLLFFKACTFWQVGLKINFVTSWYSQLVSHLLIRSFVCSLLHVCLLYMTLLLLLFINFLGDTECSWASAVFSCQSSCNALNKTFDCNSPVHPKQCIGCSCIEWGCAHQQCDQQRKTGNAGMCSLQNCRKSECDMECNGWNCDQQCNSGANKCNLKCNSTNCCRQNCKNGECDMKCHGRKCRQQCNSGACKCNLRCDSKQTCRQICNGGECSSECHGQYCEQTCDQDSIKCSLRCYGKQNCTQKCNHGECTLECYGPNCKQLCNVSLHQCVRTSKTTTMKKTTLAVASVNHPPCSHY